MTQAQKNAVGELPSIVQPHATEAMEAALTGNTTATKRAFRQMHNAKSRATIIKPFSMEDDNAITHFEVMVMDLASAA